MNRKLKDTILYILSKSEFSITKTRLVKLIYLADLFSKQKKGKTITDVRYNYYYYGPFSKLIVEELDKLVAEKVIEERHVASQQGKKYLVYSTYNKVATFPSLEQDDLGILESVLQKYGSIDFKDLIAYVYETEPIKKNYQGKEDIL